MFVFFKEKKTPFNQSDCGENTFENRYNFATKCGATATFDPPKDSP